MALATLAQAKTHLNIPTATTTYDTELTTFIDVAGALVEGYCDRTWSTTAVTETFDGGGSVFLLRKTPVTSVTSVTSNGTVLAATQYQVDLHDGIVKTLVPTFPYHVSPDEWVAPGLATVSIVYVPGDGGTVPDLVRHACLETVRHLWQTQRGSMAGRNPLNGDDYTPGMSFSLPRRVMELLDPLRNVN